MSATLLLAIKHDQLPLSVNINIGTIIVTDCERPYIKKVYGAFTSKLETMILDRNE